MCRRVVSDRCTGQIARKRLVKRGGRATECGEKHRSIAERIRPTCRIYQGSEVGGKRPGSWKIERFRPFWGVKIFPLAELRIMHTILQPNHSGQTLPNFRGRSTITAWFPAVASYDSPDRTPWVGVVSGPALRHVLTACTCRRPDAHARCLPVDSRLPTEMAEADISLTCLTAVWSL